ncbi:glycosyltransferase [Sphingomonas sp. 22L2VL55-3]
MHYIESLGLRSPNLSANDIKRLFAKLLRFIRPTGRNEKETDTDRNDLTKGIRVHSPIVIPFHAYAMVRAINRRLLSLQLRSRLPKTYVLWTFSPFTYGIESNASTVIYHSVDLLHTIPGIPENAILAAERRLIKRANYTIASSTGVANHVAKFGAEALLWENVADIELFRRFHSNERQRRIIFVGNLTPGKIDFTILEKIVARGMSLALAGPSSIDGTQADQALERLINSPLVTYMGILSQQQMAIELGKSWAGIIPYHVNEYTTGVFPMKVYEYLGAGLTTICTPLPSLEAKEITGLIVVSAERFVDEVERVYRDDYRQTNGNYSGNSWESRLHQIGNIIGNSQERPL